MGGSNNMYQWDYKTRINMGGNKKKKKETKSY